MIPAGRLRLMAKTQNMKVSKVEFLFPSHSSDAGCTSEHGARSVPAAWAAPTGGSAGPALSSLNERH